MLGSQRTGPRSESGGVAWSSACCCPAARDACAHHDADAFDGRRGVRVVGTGRRTSRACAARPSASRRGSARPREQIRRRAAGVVSVVCVFKAHRTGESTARSSWDRAEDGDRARTGKPGSWRTSRQTLRDLTVEEIAAYLAAEGAAKQDRRRGLRRRGRAKDVKGRGSALQYVGRGMRLKTGSMNRRFFPYAGGSPARRAAFCVICDEFMYDALAGGRGAFWGPTCTVGRVRSSCSTTAWRNTSTAASMWRTSRVTFSWSKT